jgi:hypothetical protein
MKAHFGELKCLLQMQPPSRQGSTLRHHPAGNELAQNGSAYIAPQLAPPQQALRCLKAPAQIAAKELEDRNAQVDAQEFRRLSKSVA